jgi:hypothetical protein
MACFVAVDGSTLKPEKVCDYAFRFAAKNRAVNGFALRMVADVAAPTGHQSFS